MEPEDASISDNLADWKALMAAVHDRGYGIDDWQVFVSDERDWPDSRSGFMAFLDLTIKHGATGETAKIILADDWAQMTELLSKWQSRLEAAYVAMMVEGERDGDD